VGGAKKGGRSIADAKEQLMKATEHLKQQRDDLPVKLHLVKVEAKDEWARLEKQMRPKLEAARLVSPNVKLGFS
jgi:hypothetical protein